MRKLRSFIERTKAGVRALDKGNSSYKPWNVENCAEVWTIKNAIMNVVKLKNIIMKTVYFDNLEFAEACKNCEATFKELADALRVIE